VIPDLDPVHVFATDFAGSVRTADVSAAGTECEEH
jgi:hypothetical protein